LYATLWDNYVAKNPKKLKLKYLLPGKHRQVTQPGLEKIKKLFNQNGILPTHPFLVRFTGEKRDEEPLAEIMDGNHRCLELLERYFDYFIIL